MRGWKTWCIAAMITSIGPASADWPQFRGPTGQGVADAVDLPLTWSESSNVAWKSPVPGKGWSSPVVGGGRVWLTTADPEGKSLRALAYDVRSGKPLHDVEVFQPADPPSINTKNSYASPTPVLEGDRLYVHYGTLGTACISTESTEVVWRNAELHCDHKEGPGSSPIVLGDLVIVHLDGIDTQSVVAMNKQTGKLVWRTARTGELHANTDFRKAYSTPVPIEIDGQVQLISAGADQVIAYAPQTGKELWKIRYQGFSNVPRPLFDGRLLYLCTGYMQPQLWAVRPGGRGDVTADHVVWKFAEQVPANSSPLLYGGAIYMVSDRGILSCIDAKTGKLLWKGRLPGAYSASPILGAGRIYFFSEDGRATVLRPNVEKQEVLATNALDGRFLASPAVEGKALILRTDSHLYRIEEQ